MPPRVAFRRRSYRRTFRRYGRRRTGGSAAVVAGSMRTKRIKAYRDYPLFAPFAAARPEMKYHIAEDATLLLASDTTAPVILLNDIAQADALDKRTTNKVRMEALIIRAYLQAPDLVNSLTLGSISIVYDKQNSSGALPAITDIFESTNPLSFQNVPNRTRFELLHRKVWDFVGIGSVAATFTTKMQHVFEVKIPLNHVATYSGATGAIGELVSGALYLVLQGTSPKGAANNECPEFTCQLRLLFADM